MSQRRNHKENLKNTFELNERNPTTYQNLWDTA